MYEPFIRAIESEGLTPPDKIIADGKKHRFDSDGQGKKNGKYVFYPDEPLSGYFICYKSGIFSMWSKDYSNATPEEREKYSLIKAERKARREKEDAINQVAVQQLVAERWNKAALPDGQHPYLKKKQIKPYGLRFDEKFKNLLIPILNKKGDKINLQSISIKGGKFFQKDAQVTGGFFPIGKRDTNKIIIIVEGYATGASIHEATGNYVICAFNCGNLKPVALTMRETYPEAHIIIAADDDHLTKDNPGITKAKEAAFTVGASVVFPDFGNDRTVKETDFNDLHCLKGLDAVRKCFEAIPEPLKTSLADPGLPERQKAQLKSVKPQKIGLKIVRASTVKIKPIKWIWPGILAQGKLVFLAGDPGLGKSQVSLFICAIISSGGQWPVSDEICTKGNVLILSAEDGAEDLIVPRLKAVNADLEKIHIIQSVELSDGNEKIFDLTSDVEQLKNEAVQIGNVKIIIIDPISAYLGKIDSHRNTEVRDALNPIIKFADEIGACLLCVTHLNKGGSGNALSRVTGSIAFAAAARACFVVTRDPNDPDRRLMLPLKNNLAKDTYGFAYRIELKDLSGIEITCVAWEPDKIDLSAEEVLSTQGGNSENRAFAESFLKEELKDGFEIPCKGLYERAEEHGISRKVLWKMKDKIGAKALKSGFNEGWVWYLPIDADNEDSQNTKIPEGSLIQNRNLGGILAKTESSHATFKETI